MVYLQFGKADGTPACKLHDTTSLRPMNTSAVNFTRLYLLLLLLLLLKQQFHCLDQANVNWDVLRRQVRQGSHEIDVSVPVD